MTPAELLREWTLTSHGHTTWLAQWRGDADQIVRACCTTLACPQEPREVLLALLAEGEFEGAELLLADDLVRAELDPNVVVMLETRVALAAASASDELAGSLAELAERAAELGVPADVRSIRDAALSRLADGQAQLAALERAVHLADAARVLDDPRLADTARPAVLSEPAFARWQATVRATVERGALDDARTALAQGPHAVPSPALDELAPPHWPYRTEAFTEVIRWFFGEGVWPPGFERFIPAADDLPAWALLDALRAWYAVRGDAGLALLTALTTILRGEVLRSEVDVDNALVHIDGLGAPCFHALARGRWPDGLPVVLHRDNTFVVYVGEHALRVTFHDLAAVLHDTAHRRSRLLAHLGRQLPLPAAFPPAVADASVWWPPPTASVALPEPGAPVLLLGAPGVGKSMALHALAASTPGARLVAPHEISDLPPATALLVDAAEHLDDASLRRLRGDLSYLLHEENPPAILVAGRPELQARLRAVAPRMFRVQVLPLHPFAEIRALARMTLGWVGIDAASPNLHTRMAAYVGGNPGLLYFLCRAIAVSLAERGSQDRRMDEAVLTHAWRSENFWHAARELLWEPVRDQDGVPELLFAITELAPPGRSTTVDRVVWAMDTPEVQRDAAWVRERVEDLTLRGLLHADGDAVSLPPTGIATLVRGWASEM